MEFIFETHYDVNTLTSAFKVLRKTVLKREIYFFCILGATLFFIFSVSYVYAILPNSLALAFEILASFIIFFAVFFLFKETAAAYFSVQLSLSGAGNDRTVFSEDSFISTTDAGRFEYYYHKILLVAETADYFVFVFSKNHVQVYDKHHMQGGTTEDFRRFIEAATQKQIVHIK